MMKVVPLPSELSTRSLPQWSSMICLQTLKPSPVPPWPAWSGVFVVKKGSKILRRVCGAMPFPESVIAISASPIS